MRLQTAYGEQTRHPVRNYVSEMHTRTRGFVVVDLCAFRLGVGPLHAPTLESPDRRILDLGFILISDLSHIPSVNILKLSQIDVQNLTALLIDL